MWHSIVELCRSYPQIVIFLVLAIGYLIGQIKIGSFSLGATASILIVALIFGQLNISINPLVETLAFALFIFCIGYKVGPEFFSSLSSLGLKFIILSVFVCVIALIIALMLGHFFHFNPSFTAGMLGGAMTQSSVVGAATSVIKHLHIPAAQRSLFGSDVAIAYAITYIFGTVGLILFYRIIPYILRIDLKKEAILLNQTMGITDENEDTSMFSWFRRVDLRTYIAEQKNIIGQTIEYIEKSLGRNIHVEQIKRNGKIINVGLYNIIEKGDILSIDGRHQDLVGLTNDVGPETADEDLLQIEGEILKICILKKIVGKTLGKVSSEYGEGCFLRRITRQGHELPITSGRLIKKCDVFEVSGAKRDIEKFASEVGFAERPTQMTDLISVGLGCVLGTLLGLVAIHIGGIPITFGIGGGVLIAGLVFGWLRSARPTFGYIPNGAQWLFTDLGLNLFIACVGLSAGPRALAAIQSNGVSLFAAGAILTLVPTILGLLFGKYVLRLNIVLLLGGLTGAGTITAALNVLKDEAGNTAPAIGYTVPYAFSNVLLTIWGTLIVNLMHSL